MKGIGLMGSMMVMGLKHGQGGADIGDNIGKDLGMDLGFIGFIQVMYMLGNGLMDKVMGVEFILVRTGAGMLVNSSGELSMALDITTSGNLLSLMFSVSYFRV